MRHFIETAPRDGKFAIIEDASGKYDVACWSPAVDGWVSDNGEPVKIAPMYWHPIKGEDYLQQGLDPTHRLAQRIRLPVVRSAGELFRSLQ